MALKIGSFSEKSSKNHGNTRKNSMDTSRVYAIFGLCQKSN